MSPHGEMLLNSHLRCGKVLEICMQGYEGENVCRTLVFFQGFNSDKIVKGATPSVRWTLLCTRSPFF